MRVMEGASFPTTPEHWSKVEITVDDDDFDRLMREWGADPEKVPEVHRFQILTNLAQGLLARRMFALGGLNEEELRAEATRLKSERERLQAAVRSASPPVAKP